MSDERHVYVPWYEASLEGLDELAQIKRTVEQLPNQAPITDT
jgi:hypothetical protein